MFHPGKKRSSFLASNASFVSLTTRCTPKSKAGASCQRPASAAVGGGPTPRPRQLGVQESQREREEACVARHEAAAAAERPSKCGRAAAQIPRDRWMANESRSRGRFQAVWGPACGNRPLVTQAAGGVTRIARHRLFPRAPRRLHTPPSRSMVCTRAGRGQLGYDYELLHVCLTHLCDKACSMIMSCSRTEKMNRYENMQGGFSINSYHKTH